ncbi:helix-turn-helix domain-containing protein [Actinosynnema mirum]|uniref:Putative addiction module antidote protein n=1 Tax=Actinosynnema mirum (strain ATCC 29888 / DSM 43827 / JCM 3225 / NBRC 14064 / NCIMB 13271 / NRRL B-12336 / IMRU 3971 / 101) TaxID=446462 RepID=C6WFP5_ACTMD|nr:helix-turn-helix transcriptional regulator [Actinosynnema mirum]ACU35980.1 putative addiction module antidote protein [Actinosynnema mirum DSM 43827]
MAKMRIEQSTQNNSATAPESAAAERPTTDRRADQARDLDELRLPRGLPYRDLARRTGCARSTLHDALAGRGFPRLDTVLAVARACGDDPAGWRGRWVAARPRAGHTPGTAPTTSRQRTRPS